MVFFTCNGCGESMKKGQVEKHLVICRNCSSLSCMDCGKDFLGDSYKSHLKCITENEKYGGKAFEAKANKGDVKQQQWIQRIQEVLKKPNISSNIRSILNQMSTFDNIPRKKVKFQNWVRNSLKVFDQGVQDEVWEIFAEAQKGDPNNNAPKPSNTPAAESKSESPAATEETEKKKKSKRERKEERQNKNKKEKKDLSSEEPLQNGTKKKGKKRKMEEDENNESGNDEEAAGKKKKKQHEDASENGKKNKKRNDPRGEEQEEEAEENGADENGDEDSSNRGKFNWKGTIRALLRLAPDNELPIKKLRKKVIAQYYVVSSEQHKSEEELLATFNKKIKNNPKFRVLKEKVKLVK